MHNRNINGQSTLKQHPTNFYNVYIQHRLTHILCSFSAPLPYINVESLDTFSEPTFIIGEGEGEAGGRYTKTALLIRFKLLHRKKST